jgi:hypothetical protein
MTQSSTPDLVTTSRARRSKRILEPVRLIEVVVVIALAASSIAAVQISRSLT